MMVVWQLKEATNAPRSMKAQSMTEISPNKSDGVYTLLGSVVYKLHFPEK